MGQYFSFYYDITKVPCRIYNVNPYTNLIHFSYKDPSSTIKKSVIISISDFVKYLDSGVFFELTGTLPINDIHYSERNIFADYSKVAVATAALQRIYSVFSVNTFHPSRYSHLDDPEDPTHIQRTLNFFYDSFKFSLYSLSTQAEYIMQEPLHFSFDAS